MADKKWAPRKGRKAKFPNGIGHSTGKVIEIDDKMATLEYELRYPKGRVSTIRRRRETLLEPDPS